MANVLRREKREAVIRALVEGASVRSVERMTGVHRDTILRLMVRVGAGCARLMDTQMRDLGCRRIQLDEVWGYVAKKQRHVTEADDPRRVGDFWVYVALDPDTKCVPAYRVGKRDRATTRAFVRDLSKRLRGRVQISSDALRLYVEAVDAAFGSRADYGQIVKHYEAEPIGAGRYSPPRVVRTTKQRIWGNPDPDHISTSMVERQNLTARMHVRRLTRLTNAFSRRPENLRAAIALHYGWYNYVRRHASLRVTPAMEAGVTPHLWSMRDLVGAALDLAG